MYVHLSYIDVIFRLRGSVLKRVFPHLLLVSLISGAIVAVDHIGRYQKTECGKANSTAFTTEQCDAALPTVELDALGHKMFGFFVAFLLVFRSKVSLDRFSSGRRCLTVVSFAAVELVRKFNFFVVNPDMDDAALVAQIDRFTGAGGEERTVAGAGDAEAKAEAKAAAAAAAAAAGDDKPTARSLEAASLGALREVILARFLVEKRRQVMLLMALVYMHLRGATLDDYEDLVSKEDEDEAAAAAIAAGGKNNVARAGGVG